METIRILVTGLCLMSLIVMAVMVKKKSRHQTTAAAITFVLAVLNLILMALDELF